MGLVRKTSNKTVYPSDSVTWTARGSSESMGDVGRRGIDGGNVNNSIRKGKTPNGCPTTIVVAAADGQRCH